MRNHYDFVGKIMHTDRTGLKLNYTQQTMVSSGAPLITWNNSGKERSRQRREGWAAFRTGRSSRILRRRVVSAKAEAAPFSRLRHKDSQAQHSSTAINSHRGQPCCGGHCSSPCPAPGDSSHTAPNILYNHSHSDLHMAYFAINPHQHLLWGIKGLLH